MFISKQVNSMTNPIIPITIALLLKLQLENIQLPNYLFFRL